MAVEVFQSVFPRARFRLWSWSTWSHAVPVRLSPLPYHHLVDTVTPHRLGAAILSHHVDDFALVSAFFLFSLGCLNIFLGLIFREHAKIKRSLTSWREQAKGVLPPPVQRAASSASTLFNSSLFSEKPSSNERKGRFDGYGFGRQAEKKAGLRDFITRPVESLPRYAPHNRASSPGGV